MNSKGKGKSSDSCNSDFLHFPCPEMDFSFYQIGKENVSHVHYAFKYLFIDNKIITLPNVENRSSLPFTTTQMLL